MGCASCQRGDSGLAPKTLSNCIQVRPVRRHSHSSAIKKGGGEECGGVRYCLCSRREKTKNGKE